MTDLILIADIKGYAAVFNKRDLNGDIIERGAFAASLKQRAPIRMLYQHAAETPIGRWTSLVEDQHGLFATGEILLSSPRAREVHALLAGGAIDGLSIGYQTARAQKARGQGRRILQADLWEVSIVTFPMAEAARVTHVGKPRPDFSPDSGCAFPHTLHALAHDRARPANARRRADDESAVFVAERALAPPPASARHFADALRGAASILSV